MTKINKKYQNSVQYHFSLHCKNIAPKLIQRTRISNCELAFKSSVNNIYNLAKMLKQKLLMQFDQLIDIAVIDHPKKKKRFTVTYLLLSIRFNCRAYLITKASETQAISSFVSIFKSAGWLEREVWDLYGLFVNNNPDLRRILTDYGFLGHPLRKDFPLFGFNEVFFCEQTKKIVYYPVNIDQGFRSFTFRNNISK